MMTPSRSATMHHPIGADGLLVIQLEDADVQLVGVDGDTVTITADERGGIDALAFEPGERSLAVSTGQGSTPADLSIEVPAGATVVVGSRSGDIAAARLTGDVRVTTGSGDVTVRDAAGTLAIEAVSGDVRIEAPAELDVVARTVSGDLGVRAALLRRAEVTTTSGDLTIAAGFAAGGAFRIETVSGDTTIEALSAVRLEATSLTGDVHGPSVGGRDDQPRGTIVVGAKSGPTIAFRSTSGDVSLRMAQDSTAAIAAVPPVIADPPPTTTATVDPSLDVLRALERGEIDVIEATERLNALDAEADPDA